MVQAAKRQGPRSTIPAASRGHDKSPRRTPRAASRSKSRNPQTNGFLERGPILPAGGQLFEELVGGSKVVRSVSHLGLESCWSSPGVQATGLPQIHQGSLICCPAPPRQARGERSGLEVGDCLAALAVIRAVRECSQRADKPVGIPLAPKVVDGAVLVDRRTGQGEGAVEPATLQPS
jgi:hypothetical protein